jgi:hypothetical protein
MDATTTERETGKFTTYFSYAALLNKIDNANNVLKTLMEQSHHRERLEKVWQASKGPLSRHNTVKRIQIAGTMRSFRESAENVLARIGI